MIFHTARKYFIISPSAGVRSIAMNVSVCVCLSVSSHNYLKKHMSELHKIFCTCYLWPRLGPPQTTVQCYIVPVLWMTS